MVVDVQCDYAKQNLGNMRTGEADMAALEATMRTIGEKIPASCLVLIETTVAPGTTEFVAWPILKKAFAARGIKTEPLLAHSFERVMPGREYVSSIRDFWRVCAGCNAEGPARVEKFLHEVLNTKEFPLTVMDRPIESETTKIVENSYRATILAFLNEWSLFAERNGVDLIKVIKAIKMRPTHSNIIFPGPGIGGYCLPKDGGLGYWAYKHILGFEDGDSVFKITPTAIDINDTRGLHVAELTRDALRNMGHYIAGADVLICGASYRQDVGDTRYSGSEMVVRKLTEMGAEMRDPRSVCRALVRVGKTGHLSRAGPLLETILPQPGRTGQRPRPERPQGALDHAEAVILAVPHAALSRVEARRRRQVGRRTAGGDRLLRHPERRQDPALFRAGLRSQGARPRPHPAHQGRDAQETAFALVQAAVRPALLSGPSHAWPVRPCRAQFSLIRGSIGNRPRTSWVSPGGR